MTAETWIAAGIVCVCAACLFVLRNTLWMTFKEAWRERKEKDA